MARKQRMPKALKDMMGMIGVAAHNSRVSVQDIIDNHDLSDEEVSDFGDAILALHNMYLLSPHQLVVMMGYYNDIIQVFEEDEAGFRGYSGIINDFMEGRNFYGQLEQPTRRVVSPQPKYDVGDVAYVMSHNKPRQAKVKQVVVDKFAKEVGSSQTSQSNPPRTITVQTVTYTLSFNIYEYKDLKLANSWMRSETLEENVYTTKEELLATL